MAQTGWRIDGELADILPVHSTILAPEISDLHFDERHNRYIAVSDSDQALFTVALNQTSRPFTVALTARLPLTTNSGAALTAASDYEGVALLPSGQIAVANEIDQSLLIFDRAGRQQQHIRAVKQLGFHLLGDTKRNKGIEGLAVSSAGELWVINEAQTRTDASDQLAAPRFSRLLVFNARLSPGPQWAYPLEPGRGLLNSYGISALEALPDEQFLVLERMVTFDLRYAGPAIQHQIYLIAPRRKIPGAGVNISGIPSLAKAEFTPLRKQLLWEGSFGRYNFEAMALGAERDDGSYPLLLMSDDGQGLKAGALVLSVVPTPSD